MSRQPIREQYERLVESDWPGRVERLLDDVPADRRQPAFGTYARQRFRPMIKRFFAAADHKLRDAEEMHALRIEGKQLRYAMEIFAAVFPPQVRSRCYEALEQLQNTLGEFTDHASAADRFRRWSREKAAASNREVIERILEEEEARADQARKVFSRWWNPSRRRSLRRRFERTLRKASA